jgi:salicylate hydroxylase
MVQYIAQGAAMALEDAICLADRVDQCDGEFPAAFKAYEGIRIVRSARVQLSSLMLDRFYHADGVERLVRNAMFEGRTESQHYDKLEWLFGAPPYVRAWRAQRG